VTLLMSKYINFVDVINEKLYILVMLLVSNYVDFWCCCLWVSLCIISLL